MSEDLKKMIKRILAVVGLVFIGLCLFGMIYNALSAGPPALTLLFLFGLMVVPAIIFLLIHFSRL